MSDPLQMLFGHQLRLIIPAHRLAHAMCWKSVMGGEGSAGDNQCGLQDTLRPSLP
jgi:hypothetical protein